MSWIPSFRQTDQKNLGTFQSKLGYQTMWVSHEVIGYHSISPIPHLKTGFFSKSMMETHRTMTTYTGVHSPLDTCIHFYRNTWIDSFWRVHKHVYLIFIYIACIAVSLANVRWTSHNFSPPQLCQHPPPPFLLTKNTERRWTCPGITWQIRCSLCPSHVWEQRKKQ